MAARKEDLEGWSPAQFKDDRRAKAACELVSCIVLDDDASALPLERVREIWSFCAGVVHSTFSATPMAPKWRIVLLCDRDMTPDEHARVWAVVAGFAATRGQTLDEGTKDVSRLWFRPAIREGAAYEWAELSGASINVDAALAAEPPPQAPANAPREAGADGATADASRAAAAAALAAGFPPDGQRRAAHMALAGACRASGLPETEAAGFVSLVYRALGDERPAVHAGIVRQTYAKPDDAPVTGWTTLSRHINPDVVDAARKLLSGTAAMERRLAEVQTVAASDDGPEPTAEQRALRIIGRDCTRLQTGLPTIDRATRGGILRRKVVVIGGAPGAGKTALLVRWAYTWLARGFPVGILAADEDADGLLTRLGQLHGIPRDAIERGDPTACRALAAWCSSVPLILSDGDEGGSIESLSRKLRAAANGKPSAMVVDSIQTARSENQVPTGTDVRAKINAIIRALKHAAKVDSHVVAASSELSRAAYRNKDQAENANALAAFKESGDIEYGVSLGIVLSSRQGTSELVDGEVVKNRLGPEKPQFMLRLDHERADVQETNATDVKAADPLYFLKVEIKAEVEKACGTPMTKTQLANRVGGQTKRAFKAIGELLDAHELHQEQRGIRFPLPGDPGYVDRVSN